METQKSLEITEKVSSNFLYFILTQDFENPIFSSLKLENDFPSFDSSEILFDKTSDFSLEYSNKQNIKEIRRKLGIFELSSKFDKIFKELSTRYGAKISQNIRNRNIQELESQPFYPELSKSLSDYDYLVFEVAIGINKIIQIIPFLEEFIKSKEFVFDLIGQKKGDSNEYKGAIIYQKNKKAMVEKFTEELKHSDFFYRRLYLKESLKMEDFKIRSRRSRVQTRMIVQFWQEYHDNYFEKFEHELKIIQFLEENKVFFFEYDPIKKIEAKKNIHLILNFLLNEIQFLSIEISKQYWKESIEKTFNWRNLIILVAEKDTTLLINILGKYNNVHSFIEEYLSTQIKSEWINYALFDKSRFKKAVDHQKFNHKRNCSLSGFEEKFKYLKIEFQQNKKSLDMILRILRDTHNI